MGIARRQRADRPRLAAIAAALGVLGAVPAAAVEYSGRQHQLQVRVPRVETSARVDGVLDEAVWSQAATLSDFSQYAPADGRPAENRTDVLVWYAPTAIYFGIRAHARPGTVQATLANRDRLAGDDEVQILLGTFNDGRQALLFAVNPLGVQADGTLVEGLRGVRGEFSGLSGGREAPDLSADFVFESKGRVTDYGYEVEMRIPFKTLRYQSADPQDWGLHIVRVVQSTGHEETWAPATRAAASFLAQSGTLAGLTDLRRGVVLDLNPFVTARSDGAPRPDGSGWRYDTGAPEAGGNVRWGMTPSLTLNGTVNPDFSQVESDAGQFVFDPRQALFYPEKRPFFLDGLELFQSPNNLIYTRQVAAPLGAAKITGKVAGTTIAYLGAVDDETTSSSGSDHPLFNLLRVQRDLGTGSKVALVYTDRVEPGRSNRVVGADARMTFRKVYTVQAQGVASRTSEAGALVTGPLWDVSLQRSGQRFSFRYAVRGVDDTFRTESGFVNRTGIARAAATNEITVYGRKGAALERWSGTALVSGTWVYDDFINGRSAQDRMLHLTNNVVLRGGWQAGQTVMIESFGYDAALYRDYALIETVAGGQEVLRPFVGTPRLSNLDWLITAETPRVKGLSGNVFWLWGKDENFYEWSPANVLFLNVGGQWRPTERLRVDGYWQIQSYERRTDQTKVGWRKLPRVKVEYQVARHVFLRLVTEYDSQFQDDLRDDSRTEWPIAIVDRDTGTWERATGHHRRMLRSDVLFSYQPTPGTVVFAGYGSTLADPDPRGRTDPRRVADGFFLKVSYLYRVR